MIIAKIKPNRNTSVFHEFSRPGRRHLTFPSVNTKMKLSGPAVSHTQPARRHLSPNHQPKGCDNMSKYNPLWEYVQKNGTPSFKLTFEEIQSIAGLPIDHSFLKYKKELADYSYEVGKISMKEQTVIFNKINR